MFTVLFLCTGNRCRSPVAEAAVNRMRRTFPIAATSAGVLDAGPGPSPPETVAAAGALGLHLSPHRSRVATAELMNGVDLVVGFERAHLAHAVVELGAAYERSFLLNELVRLIRHVSVTLPPGSEERAREVVRLAHVQREEHPEFVVGEEIGDPLGRPRSVQEETAQRIAELCRRLVLGLFEEDRAPSPSEAST